GYSWITGDGNVERLLTQTGILGPIIFVLLMWCTQPLGVPGFVYMVPAGIVWPYPLAIALSWIGNIGASYIAFMFARWFARDWVRYRIPPRMHRYDDRLEQGGLRPVILLRLVFGQLPPADWLLGVSKVTQRNFLIGTGIGIIPGVVFFVVAGDSLVDVLRDLPILARRIAIGILIGLAVGRRVWKRRKRAAADATASEATSS
ncbi:MAG: TVP38/TMEM64 family protein, partial [Actinobacteria bacterium]|nr:TVP38/TMEM64 family protein [Actinomycetota bacterium]